MSSSCLQLRVDDESETYALRDCGQLRGRLGDAEILIGDRRWDVSYRRHRVGRIAVAERTPDAWPDAAWYPAWRPRGTLCLEHAEYRLFPHALTGRWKLREVGGATIATLLRKGWWTGLDIELEPAARASGDVWLLVLFAAWSIMRGPPGPMP